MQLVVELYRIAEVAANWLRLCPLRILKKDMVMPLTDLCTIIKPCFVACLQAAGKQFYSMQGLKYRSCRGITNYSNLPLNCRLSYLPYLLNIKKPLILWILFPSL